ncbi:MAG: hypothetical protein ACR2JC_09905 [Chloroflexota bacterium]
MITGKILKIRGWPEGRVIGHAKAAAGRLESEGREREAILDRLDQVLNNPDAYAEDAIFDATALELIAIRKREEERAAVPVLHPAPLPYGVWGAEQIDAGAIAQMNAAMRLPSRACALFSSRRPARPAPSSSARGCRRSLTCSQARSKGST